MLETLRARIADLRGRGIYARYHADARGCIFIHIPKTGGTSVAVALFGTDSRHVPIAEYIQANPRKARRYFKFTIVRNPYDRLVSSFHFLKQGGLHQWDRRWAEENLTEYPDFRTFVREWLTVENAASWAHFVPQYQFVTDSRGTVCMDFIGRYESLAADFAQVAARLGKDVSLPWENQGRHEHYATYYDDETRRLVASVYAKDLELFGYGFD